MLTQSTLRSTSPNNRMRNIDVWINVWAMKKSVNYKVREFLDLLRSRNMK